MEDYDKHYMALGLRRGATQEEIRSAFRRMAKLYHPDQDASLDAEMRYRDARRAYDALRKRIDTQPSKPPNQASETRQAARDDAKKHQTASGTGWYAYEDDGGFDFSDLLWAYGARKKIKERIPFSFEKIPVILFESVKEVAGVGMLFRVLLYVAIIKGMFGELEYGGLISYVIIFCSLACCAFFRYYFSSDPAAVNSNMAANFLGSLLYGAGVSFLLCIIHLGLDLNVSFSDFLSVAAVMFLTLFLLWVHPIIWLWGQGRTFGKNPWDNGWGR